PAVPPADDLRRDLPGRRAGVAGLGGAAAQSAVPAGAARLTAPRVSYVRCLRGLGSGREYPADVPMNLDPADGRPVEMVLDLERLAAEKPDAAWYDPTRRDLWRFGALMALDIADPEDARYIVPLNGGATP